MYIYSKPFLSQATDSNIKLFVYISDLVYVGKVFLNRVFMRISAFKTMEPLTFMNLSLKVIVCRSLFLNSKPNYAGEDMWLRAKTEVKS